MREEWRVIIRTAQKLKNSKTQNLGHLWEMLSLQATDFHWEQNQYRKTTCTNRYCSLRLCQRVWFAMMMSYFLISNSLSIILYLIWSSDLIWSDLTFSSLLQNVLTMSYLCHTHAHTHRRSKRRRSTPLWIPYVLLGVPNTKKLVFYSFQSSPAAPHRKACYYHCCRRLSVLMSTLFPTRPRKKTAQNNVNF